MLAIVDLRISNLQSVLNAFERVGIKGTVTSDKNEVAKAQAVILPGVGAFAKGMASIKNNGLLEILRHKGKEEKVPFLGICLGMQLLADYSQEGGRNSGLGIVEGGVEKLNPTQEGFRVPNISWCPVIPAKKGVLFPDTAKKDAFYFVHSYHLEPVNKDLIAGEIEYSGQKICAAIEYGNIFGAQFHPEKSQDAGLDMLYNFRLQLEKEGVI